jgi:hypothetical protein
MFSITQCPLHYTRVAELWRWPAVLALSTCGRHMGINLTRSIRLREEKLTGSIIGFPRPNKRQKVKFAIRSFLSPKQPWQIIV